MIAERALLLVTLARFGGSVGGNLGALQSRDRREGRGARASPFDVAAERPRHLVVAGGASGQPHTGHLVELRQRIEIDFAIVDVEHRARRLPLVAERRHQVAEIRRAPASSPSPGHLQRSRTQTTSPSRLEAVIVEPSTALGNRLHLAAALEHVERAGKVASPQCALVASEKISRCAETGSSTCVISCSGQLAISPRPSSSTRAIRHEVERSIRSGRSGT